MFKAMYRKDGWVLGRCSECGKLNYVEPHGVTAFCRRENDMTVHTSIPYTSRDVSGTVYIGPSRPTLEA